MRKALLVIPGYCIGLGGLLLITYRTVLAVLSESKAVIVHVNSFGEQYLDLACLVFLWIVCLVGLSSLSTLMSEKKDKRLLCSETPRDDAWITPMTSLGHTTSFHSTPLVMVPEDPDTEWYPTAQNESLGVGSPGGVSLSVLIETQEF
ncbi:MAG: hypothetical protein WC525_02325 [Candidatus Thermoplasmatota archaeon]